jgi:hypothetical protein
VDLKDIEAWGRELLLHEARKRGLRTPEVYSRGELIRLILKHDGAPTNVREAARLLGGIWGQAKYAWRAKFGAQLGTGSGVGGGSARGDAGRYDRDAERAAVGARAAQIGGAAAPGVGASDAERAADSGGSSRAQGESYKVEADRGASGKSEVSAQGAATAPGREESGRFTREESRAATRLDRSRTESHSDKKDELAADAQRTGSQSSTLQSPWSMPPEAPRLRLVEPPNQGALEVAPTSVVAAGTPYSMPLPAATPAVHTPAAAGTTGFAATATYPQAASTEQLSYGPHPADGLLLRWRVTPEAIERARAVLGSAGELAVRIVAVRIEPHAAVKTEIIDHGPINDAGDWTAPLLPTEARYVSAIGVRTPERFVSIVHAAS